MLGNAVVTTRLSRVTMNRAAETSASVQPVRRAVVISILLIDGPISWTDKFFYADAGAAA